MTGYILNLYKCAMIPHHQRHGFNEYLADNNSGVAPIPLLSYGEYDRIHCESISDFSRYRDVDQRTQQWIGPRQSMLLYTLNDTPAHSQRDLLGVLFPCETPVSPRTTDSLNNRFIIITLITLNPELKKVPSFATVLQQCASVVHTQVDHVKKYHGELLSSPDKIECTVYGSFSSSELVIVWSAENFSDALRIAECLRHLKAPIKDSQKELCPFVSIYSIVAELSQSQFTLDQQSMIKGTAQIYISFIDTVASCKEQQDYVKKIIDKIMANAEELGEEAAGLKKAISFQPCVGEYDYCISSPAKLVCGKYSDIFHRNGLLHWQSEEYNQHIAKTQTQLFYEGFDNLGNATISWPDSLDFENSTKNGPSLYGDFFPAVHNRIYGASECNNDPLVLINEYPQKGLRGVIKEKFPETVGLCDTLDLLYTDFINNISNLVSTAWANDFAEQFAAVLDYIADIIKSHYEEDGDILEVSAPTLMANISGIVNKFKEVIYHVAQSQRTIFIVPSCHLRYMGQYDMILHAYYGIIKYYMLLSTLLDSTDEQPQLIPMLTVDIIPEINTNSYKILASTDIKNNFNAETGHELPTQTMGRCRQIFAVNLPLAAMGDILRYSMALAHETFHYITPYDRNKRNQTLGLIFFSEFCAQILVEKSVENLFFDNIEQNYQYYQIRDDFRATCKKMAARILPHIYKAATSDYMIIYNRICNLFEGKKNGSGKINENYCPWETFRGYLMQELMDLLIGKSVCGSINDILSRFVRETKNELQTLMKKHFQALLDKCKSDGKLSNEDAITLNSIMESQIESVCSDNFRFEKIEHMDLDWLISDSSKLADGFYEACQDLPMIRIFNLSITDYMVFRNRHRNDLLDLENYNEISDAYRVAMIYDYMSVDESGSKEILNEQDTISQFESLYEDYYELFSNVPEMVSGTSHSVTDKVKEQISDSFNSYLTGVSFYCSLADELRGIFIDLLEDADIFRQPEVRKEITNNFLANAYSTWKSAVCLSDHKEKNSIIFNNNISMIQYFQVQEPLSVINSEHMDKRNKKKD